MFLILITVKDFKFYVKLMFELIVNRYRSRKFWISLIILNLCFSFFIPYIMIILFTLISHLLVNNYLRINYAKVLQGD